MPASPVSTVDGAGNVNWVNPAIPPAFWVLELVYPDGTPSIYQADFVDIAGALQTFNAYGVPWPGGYGVLLSGIDANGNLVYAPTLSSNVTRNQ